MEITAAAIAVTVNSSDEKLSLSTFILATLKYLSVSFLGIKNHVRALSIMGNYNKY